MCLPTGYPHRSPSMSRTGFGPVFARSDQNNSSPHNRESLPPPGLSPYPHDRYLCRNRPMPSLLICVWRSHITLETVARLPGPIRGLAREIPGEHGSGPRAMTFGLPPVRLVADFRASAMGSKSNSPGSVATVSNFRLIGCSGQVKISNMLTLRLTRLDTL